MMKNMNDILVSVICILFTIGVYAVCNKIYQKHKYQLLNPVLTSSAVLMSVLVLLKIPYKTYSAGCSIITYLLGPLVLVLAIPLYNNRESLKRNFILIIGGILAGVITSFVSVVGLCKLMNIDKSVMLSLIPKSITTPMAVEAVKMLNGVEAVTIIAVMLTGIAGAWFAPIVIKYAKIKNDTAKGIGIGSSSHVFGTTKAVEMGEEIGAASGLAIAITGIITILAVIIFF